MYMLNLDLDVRKNSFSFLRKEI